MNWSINRETGGFIDWEDYMDKKYTQNFEEMRKMIVYLDAAGRAMSALYYKHSDPDWSDENFDAYIRYMKKLNEKYPEFSEYMSILHEVGK